MLLNGLHLTSEVLHLKIMTESLFGDGALNELKIDFADY